MSVDRWLHELQKAERHMTETTTFDSKNAMRFGIQLYMALMWARLQGFWSQHAGALGRAFSEMIFFLAHSLNWSGWPSSADSHFILCCCWLGIHTLLHACLDVLFAAKKSDNVKTYQDHNSIWGLSGMI